VLGAGLAGLSTAYNLMQRGCDVTILEAQHRPGGRVLTERSEFVHGGHAEMGATRIFETHQYTLEYVEKFGLELIPYDAGTRAFYLQGERFLAPPPGQPWPLIGFADGEQPDPFARFDAYLNSGFAKLGDVFDPGWPGSVPSTQELDNTTFDGYLAAQGASKTWRDWFYAQEGRVGLLNAAAGFAEEEVASGNVVRSIKGGNDRLPYAFANALGHRLKYGSQVVRIAQDIHGVTVGYVDRLGRHELRADRCVVAMPFVPLRKVAITTPFSPQKMEAIRTLRYAAAARCFFQTRTRFWKNDPLGPLGGLNLVGTDTMAGRVWNTSSQQLDPVMGMLHAYMIDTDAIEFASHGHRRADAMRKLFRTLVPGIDGQVVRVAHKAWQEDRWSGGVTGVVEPGDYHWMFPAMRRVEGRVHFAGEHTSLWIAWMNGALESAERVVGEVLQAFGDS